MKIKAIFISLLLLILCSFSLNKITKLKGRIVSYGNMPFNYPVLVTEDEKPIIIKDGKYSKEELFSYQGRKISVTGIITKEKELSKTIYYIDIEDIEVIK